MNSFTAIRKAALAKRDSAIKKARSEYAETLKRISALEKDILKRDPSPHCTLSSCVESLVPSDRTFTIVEIVTGLKAMDSARVWRKRSVDNYIFKLRERGIVRRVKKSSRTSPATYVRVGVHVEPVPFQDMSLASVVEVMLKGKPMTQTELVVHMLEAGYETTMEKTTLRDAVGVALRGDEGRFCRDGDKWGCC